MLPLSGTKWLKLDRSNVIHNLALTGLIVPSSLEEVSRPVQHTGFLRSLSLGLFKPHMHSCNFLFCIHSRCLSLYLSVLLALSLSLSLSLSLFLYPLSLSLSLPFSLSISFSLSMSVSRSLLCSLSLSLSLLLSLSLSPCVFLSFSLILTCLKPSAGAKKRQKQLESLL